MLHLQHIYANIVIRKNQVLGEELIMKRFISLAIIASLAVSYTVPVMAIENTAKDKKSKVEKIKPTQNLLLPITDTNFQAIASSYPSGCQ